MAGIAIAVAIAFVIFAVIVFACALGVGAWLWRESPGTVLCIAAFVGLFIMWAYAMGSPDAAVARFSGCSAFLLLLHTIGCYCAVRADEGDKWHKFYFYFNAVATIASAACWSLAPQAGDATAVGFATGVLAIYASLATVGFALRIGGSASYI